MRCRIWLLSWSLSVLCRATAAAIKTRLYIKINTIVFNWSFNWWIVQNCYLAFKDSHLLYPSLCVLKWIGKWDLFPVVRCLCNKFQQWFYFKVNIKKALVQNTIIVLNDIIIAFSAVTYFSFWKERVRIKHCVTLYQALCKRITGESW